MVAFAAGRKIGVINAVAAGDRAYVVTDLMSAFMASFGVEGEEGEALEPEPVSVIAFTMSPVGTTP